MPFRLQFFEDQLLRLTPPNDLNDPFDAKPSIEAIRRKAAFMVDQHGEGAVSPMPTCYIILVLLIILNRSCQNTGSFR